VSLLYFAVSHAISDVIYLIIVQNMRMASHIHELGNADTYLANQQIHTDKICWSVLLQMADFACWDLIILMQSISVH
jgi:hypothetical protein